MKKVKFKNGDKVWFVHQKFFTASGEEFCKYEIIEGTVDFYNWQTRIETPCKNGKTKVTFVSPNERNRIFSSLTDAFDEMRKLRNEVIQHIEKKITAYSKALKKLKRITNEDKN